MWPDEAVRAHLHETALALERECGGRVVKRANLHQTLVFLGDCVPASMHDVADRAAALGFAPFELEFAVTGYWRHNRLVWAAPHATPAPLGALVDALRQGSRAAGVRVDERRYASHVTLIRDARAPATAHGLALTWRVTDFALIESARGERGPAYRVLARWPLSG